MEENNILARYRLKEKLTGGAFVVFFVLSENLNFPSV